MKKVARSISILDAARDPNLFGRWFKDPKTWEAWFAFLAALFALPMTPEQRAIYEACTGRKEPPSAPASEAWLSVGRRGGKSLIMAIVAVFLGAFHNYRPYLAPGERGTIMIVASDRRQARTVVRYVRALLVNVPMLARMVERETAESFDLSNSVTIEVGTASYRSVRGYTIVSSICDEIAFWPSDDSASPDYEILDALRPGMSTIPNAMLICASSPYSRRGALWDAHRRHYGRDGDPILVWQAPTRTMNPTVPERVVAEALERDPASAAAEYMAQFRADVQSLLSREAVESVIALGVRERAPVSGIEYKAFVDFAGGSGTDSATLAIGSRRDDIAVLDAIREVKPPFSPESVVGEFAELLRQYRVDRVTGDRFGGEFPREAMRKHDIKYEVAEKAKSDYYRDLLAAINARQVDLLENERLTNQLIGLERRVARSGRDSIDHGPNGHDDLANALAGVVAMVNVRSTYQSDMKWIDADDDDTRESFRREIFNRLYPNYYS